MHPWAPSLFFCGTSEEVAGFFLVNLSVYTFYLQQLRKLDEVPPLSCPVCILTPHSVHAFSRNTIDWYFPKKSIPGNENFQVNNIFSLPLLPFFLDEFIILSYPLSTLPYMRPCWQGSRWEGGSSRQRLMSDKWCNNHTHTVPSRWDEVLIELSFSIIPPVWNPCSSLRHRNPILVAGAWLR